MEIFVIQMLFMRRFPRRKLFVPKLIATTALSVVFVFVPNLSIGFFDTSFLIVLAYTIVAAFLLFDTDVMNCVFYGLAAWSAQHIAWSFFLIACMSFKMTAAVAATVYVCIFLATYAAVFFAFSFGRKNFVVKSERLAVVISSALILLLTTVLYDAAIKYDGNSVWYALYAVISCVLVLIVQFGITSKEALKSKSERLENEKALLEGLLYNQSKQHRLAGETVEIINRKCHDLEYQVRMLREAGSDGEKYIDEIEKAVMVYGDIAKTGNDALDITLTEKCLLCDEHGIKLSYMVDGEALAILQPTDVSALFGNLLDNAIECSIGEESGKRIIRLKAAEVRGYLSIHCENYCSRTVEFDDGLPVSARKATGFHGFGTRTIRYIAEKYGGSVVMRQDDGLFNVNMILPMGGASDGARTA